jgi:hypothetical protein
MIVLDQPIDYPDLQAYNAAHPEAPAPTDPDWQHGLSDVYEYLDEDRMPFYIAGPDDIGNVIVAGAGTEVGTVRLLATGMTLEEFHRPLGLDQRPRTEHALLAAYRATGQA